MVHPGRAVASCRGMPMLDIKCQSLQPDAGWGCSATHHGRRKGGPAGGVPLRGHPREGFCGDNTSLIESRAEELTSCFWVKAGTLAPEEGASSRRGTNYRRISPPCRGVERTIRDQFLKSLYLYFNRNLSDKRGGS